MARSYTSLPKRTTLTYKQRLTICEHARKNPDIKHGDLAIWAALEFRLPKPPSDATIRAIRTKEEEWKAALASGSVDAGNRRKKSQVQAPEVEMALLEWIAEQDNDHIKCKEIQNKAEELADAMGIPHDKRPKYSNGWLSSFQERHGLTPGAKQRKQKKMKSLSDPIPARIVLTYKQRHQLCQHASANPELNKTQLAAWATEKFRLRKYISNHAVSNILKRADEWERVAVRDAINIKHLRLPAAPEVDALLATWLMRRRDRGVHTSGREIMDKGRSIANELQIPEKEQPKFSKGWLQSFLTRHHLTSWDTAGKRRAAVEDEGSRKKSRVDHILN
ncbi:hypothetical protein Poli38472_012436 [Pythium oligandrum]|uniref:HTH CENPB-type domain-containing protein n=1 Tax=Pythium oligandrum TaxID=41045 RepID=A0A8K1FKN8_PYTOL|nr:hypothetical protein Poli38472_012436 [Pythium oligandrum]|eukprot:TMW67320.1 hypothetical protein Poli38472_012436 [Pythium oligandrum]